MRRSVMVLLAGVAAAVLAVAGMAGVARAGDGEMLPSAIKIDCAEGTVTLPLFDDGLITSAGKGPRNASLEGLRALPGISNCPIVAVF